MCIILLSKHCNTSESADYKNLTLPTVNVESFGKAPWKSCTVVTSRSGPEFAPKLMVVASPSSPV